MLNLIERLTRDAALCDVNGHNLAARNYRASMAEIDRLNAQVASLRETLIYVREVVLSDGYLRDGLMVSAINKELTADPQEWIATHDAKVRDDALEEAAICAESAASDDNKYSIAESIRAMKGTK